ncbi:MAG: Uncharacterized protein JWP80_4176, partial [Pseudomonas sp.]|nr:Uncharacterized protein [Pseudomonas sp.]
IEDSQGVLIPDGRETSDTRVTVFGTAQRGSYVSIDDDSESWGAAPAADGTWTKTLNGLMVKEYSITAKGLYDNEPVSDAWRFRVDVSQPDIVYENFNFEPDRMFYGPGSTIEVPTMKFTMSAGERTAALGIAPVQEGVPLMDGQFVTMGYSVQGDHLPTTVIIDFNGGYSKVRLALLVFGQTVTCTCYDAFDITLAVKDFLPGSQWAELSAPDGRAIYKIKMYMRGLCWLDNFTMWI